MRKLYFLSCLFLLITIQSSARQQPVIGLVLDSITHFPVSEGTIINGTSNKSVTTDEKGFFHLEASANEKLYVMAKSYLPDTLQYSLMYTDTILIYLSPAGNLLPDVVVTTKYSKYQLDSMERKIDFEQLNGRKIPALSSSHPSGFGLTFNLDPLLKKKYKSQKKQQKLFDEAEKEAYVNYRFSPHVVAYFTGFKSDMLRNFMNFYTPDYAWLRTHPANEDVLYLINDKLKAYKTSRKK